MKLTRKEALRQLEILYDVNTPEEKRRLSFLTLRGLVKLLLPHDAEVKQED